MKTPSKDHLEIINLLSATYPNDKWPKERIIIFAHALEDIPIGTLKEATMFYIKSNTSDFGPSPGAIREKVAEIIRLENNVPTSGEAWSQVIKAIKTAKWDIRNQRSIQPVFELDIINKAVNAVGWYQICTSDKIGIERAHFYKAYDQLLSRGVQEMNLPDTVRARLPEPQNPMAVMQQLADGKAVSNDHN